MKMQPRTSITKECWLLRVQHQNRGIRGTTRKKSHRKEATRPAFRKVEWITPVMKNFMKSMITWRRRYGSTFHQKKRTCKNTNNVKTGLSHWILTTTFSGRSPSLISTKRRWTGDFWAETNGARSEFRTPFERKTLKVRNINGGLARQSWKRTK